jgi:phosphatidylserine/phosphatidylglycerophosphate/cardiolipin synthase-like enzyme
LAAILLCCLLGAGPAAARSKTETPSPGSGTVQTLPDATYGDTLAKQIQAASQRIDLAMFLFKTSPSGNNRPAGLARDLIAARQRGVAVRVILEYSNYDPKLNRANQETAEALRKGGVTVLFDSPKRTSHAKLAVIDRRYCLVGSHNLTQSALSHNHEFSLLLDNPALAKEILAYMETLLP